MKDLTDLEKTILSIMLRKEFDRCVTPYECSRYISISDKLGLDTSEMKSDYESHFKKPYKQ